MHIGARPLTCSLLFLQVLSACASDSYFPAELLTKVDDTVAFEALRTKPAPYVGRTIRLGGQIVGSNVDRHEVNMLVREFPIRTEPVYGPVDSGKFRGMFVVRYSGEVGSQDLQNGNMIEVIGTFGGLLQTDLSGVSVPRPTVTAECFHIWRTQGDAIEDFPWLAHTRYWPLIQQTYCHDRLNTILPVS